MKKSFIYIAALALIAACNKPESLVPSQESNIITAQIEQEPATKTYMDAHNNIRWSEGDQIVGFMKSSLGLKYQILPSSVGKTSASFENVSGSNGNINAGTEWDHNIVYYPYSTSIEAAKSGSNYTLDVTLPSEQTYAAESFGNGSMAMVAVSEDNNIVFKNVLGGMKLQLKGTQKVKSITLQGNNNEKLSGAATVTAYADETKPAITMASGASNTVTLNCGNGVQLNESTATEFIIALPPVLFSKGFKVTVTDADSKTYTVETDKANTVMRSSLLIMPEQYIENKLDISWGVIGFLYGNFWEKDILMTEEGEWVVAKNVQFSELTFKIREYGYWGANYIGYAPGTEKGLVNTRLAVVTSEYAKSNLGGDCEDIKLNGPAGTYDVYFSFENLEVYVMEAGYKPGDDELIIPVQYVNLSSTSLKLYEGDIAQLTATVGPKDATDKTTVWSSDNPAVASVDQTGLVTAHSAGTAKITAAAGGKSGTCAVTVSAFAVAIADYIDEYNENHGKGIVVGMTVWAPVNCGYHAEDFKYGKLYQWGRKYGQGYGGALYDGDGYYMGEYADSTVPTIEEGGVSAITGQHKSKSDVFFTSTSEFNYDWLYPQDSKLWNSGTESNPVKTDYDPCPEGWRVPTYAELSELYQNSSWGQNESGQNGRWFSGASSYTEDVPQVFFPAAGFRYYNGGFTYERGAFGFYWSSKPSSDGAYRLGFTSSGVGMSSFYRAYGYSVRCVQVTD